MSNERPLVRFNPEAALVWLSEVVEQDGGKAVTRARLLGVRPKWKFLRDKAELLAFRLVDALNNNPAPDVWDVADGYEVRVYPTPEVWEGGGVVVVRTPGYPHLASEWQMFSEFVAGEEMPGLEAAIEALTSVARLANGLVKSPARRNCRPSQALVPATADSGEVWILHHVVPAAGRHSDRIDTYVDPVKAIGDLARQIRPRWSWMTDPEKANKPEGMPATPPANDFEAVAWYFAKPYPVGHKRHETFELWRARPDREVIDRPAGAPEYGLSETYQEMVCVCGNVAADDGFTYVDEHGRDVLPGSDWLRCESCSRVLHAMTGLVVKTLVTSRCAHCVNGVVAVPLEGLDLDDPFPFVDADGVWVHPDQDRVRVRCFTTSGVAAPDNAEALRCGQCGGDRSDWAHRHAAHRPPAEWAPEYAERHQPASVESPRG